MQKKHFVLLGIVAVLLLGLIYFVFSRPKGEVYENIDTIMGVPVNSEIIIHIPDLEEFIQNTDKKGTWKTLNKWDICRNFQSSKKEVTKILTDEEISELLDNSQLTIATKILGKDNIEFNYIFPLQTTNKTKYIEKLLQHFFANDYVINSRKYSTFKLFKVAKKDNSESFHYAFAKGLFILSTSQISIEDALLQIHNKNSLLDKKSFQQLRKIASSNDDLNIFINGATFPKLLSLKIAKQYSKFIKELTDFTTQAGLDVTINDDNILLNGFLYTDTDDFFYTNIFLNQAPVNLTIEEVIPSNTRFWAALSLSDEETYLDNYKRYLEQTGDSRAYRKFANDFKKTTDSFPEKFQYPLLDSEIALVISEDNILGETANQYTIVRTKSKSETEKTLNSLLSNWNKNQKTKHKVTNYKIDTKLSYSLYPFPTPNYSNMMWGGLFFEATTNYCTLIDNYLVFGNSKESLKAYINQIVRRKTLKHDPFYQSQKKYWVDEESSFVAYLKTGDGSFLKKYANEELQTTIADKGDLLGKFPSASIQMKTLKNMIYVNGYISYTEEIPQKPETVWQSRLDNPLRMKPIMVTNHKTHKSELIFQDTNNVLYLISNAGTILWKLPLEEPILGTIHQVDCYKNKKLQYLFNTKSKLYLIDRNANNVAKFPVRFQSEATNGIAVFDYSKNRNYRIFVACKNKQTYVYDIKGKLVEGWKPAKNENIVTQPIQHLVSKSKDYIVYTDSYRNYILSRRGEVRALPKKNFTKAENSNLEIIKGNSKQKSSLASTDNTGLVHFTQLDGTVTTKRFENFSAQHIFRSYDINTDGKNDFIFVDKNELYVFDDSGKELFTYEFDSEDISIPNFYAFSSKDKKLGLRAGNKIYLFNNDGSLYEGFPLEGYSDFTIGFMSKKDRHFNLFVAGSNDLLYNYIVH